MAVNTSPFTGLVQFPHPGAEHDASRFEGDVFPWNEGDHARKFRQVDGQWRYEDGTVGSGPLRFWGEYEPPSTARRIGPQQDRLPRWVHEPLYPPPRDGRRQNTDPLVLGGWQLSFGCRGDRCHTDGMAAGNRKNPQRAKSSESQYSLMEFMRDFPDDAACLDWLWRTRYSEDGEHAYCERCGQTRPFARYSTSQQRQSWTCTACGHHVHPTAGTIFHKSSTSLHLWFYAMYLMTSTRCGISAKQLEREIGVTYKTAWRMFTLIRNELMYQGDEPLSGTVEMDETYVGGVRRNGKTGRPGEGDRTKTPVFGMVERKGEVRAVTVPNVQRATLMPHVLKKVLPSSTVYTDELNVYKALPREGYVNHDTVEHGAGVYVSGDVHTNTIEGFWSLVKRGISGTHHNVSSARLQGYLNEYAWRYNFREANGHPAQFGLLIVRAATTRVV